MLNTVALRYFVEIADLGSIALASERLNVSGSALSRQIKLLEEQLGFALFERQSRGMVLTKEGGQLALHVRRSMLEEHRVIEEIQNSGRVHTGKIRLAASEGTMTYLLPSTLAKFRNAHPGIRFKVLVQNQSTLSESLIRGEVDIGVALGSRPNENVSIVSRVSCPTCAIVRPIHPLASRSGVTIKDIADFQVAISVATTTRDIVDLRAMMANVEIDFALECSSSSAIFNFARDSSTIAISTRISAWEWIRRGELVAVPLTDFSSLVRAYEIQVLKDRTLPRYMADFVDCMKEDMEFLGAASW